MPAGDGIVYQFRISRMGRRDVWRKIEIRGDQTLGKLDRIIRISFELDTFDHLSAFYGGKRWYRSNFGTINPLGQGDGAEIPVVSLGIGKGSKFGYVYDFGSEQHFHVTLQKTRDVELEDTYFPRVIDENVKKQYYCVDCEKRGKQTPAEMVCSYCSEEESKYVYLCQKCAEGKKHAGHFFDDIIN
ncbi:MAG: plasmid pRiA4b ORF-3 family protein [Candidatus Thermoplasmatota archaeon]|nr:plasmid pRiA4b ORF-3 family protein [Candidatus Thermoplasmatota archaeon]